MVSKFESSVLGPGRAAPASPDRALRDLPEVTSTRKGGDRNFWQLEIYVGRAKDEHRTVESVYIQSIKGTDFGRS